MSGFNAGMDQGSQSGGRMGLCHTVMSRNLAIIIIDSFVSMYVVL